MRIAGGLLTLCLVVGCKRPNEVNVTEVVLSTTRDEPSLKLVLSDGDKRYALDGKVEVTYLDGVPPKPMVVSCTGTALVKAASFDPYEGVRVKVKLEGCPKPSPSRMVEVVFTPAGESWSVKGHTPWVARRVTEDYQKRELEEQRADQTAACSGAVREAAVAERDKAKPQVESEFAKASPAMKNGIAALLANEPPCQHSLGVYVRWSFGDLDLQAALKGDKDVWQDTMEQAPWPKDLGKPIAESLVRRGQGWLQADDNPVGDPAAGDHARVVIMLRVDGTGEHFKAGKSSFPVLQVHRSLQVVIPPGFNKTDDLGTVAFEVQGQKVDYKEQVDRVYGDSTLGPNTFALMVQQLTDKLDLGAKVFAAQ